MGDGKTDGRERKEEGGRERVEEEFVGMRYRDRDGRTEMAERRPCQGQTHFTHYHQRGDGTHLPPWLKMTSAGTRRHLAARYTTEIERERHENNGKGWKETDKRTKLGIMGVERCCFEMLPYCTTGTEHTYSLSFPTEWVHTHICAFTSTEALNGAQKE